MGDFQIGSAVITLPDGITDEQRKAAIAKFRQSPEFDKLIDKSSGAPARVRMVVGSAPVKDRLANIKRFFPDAVNYGEDNFVFTNPNTGRPTLYNPPGLDIVGDLSSVAREISQATGATMGATVGLAGGPLGTAVGAGTGSAVSGNLFDISMSLLEGQKRTVTPAQAVTDTGLDFAATATGQRIGELAPQFVKRAFGTIGNGAKNLAKNFLRLRIEPPAGAATGSRAIGGLEKMLESTPSATAVMQRQAEKVLAQTAKAADDISGRLGPIQTRTGAGETIKRAAIRAADAFNFKQEKAYQVAFDLVGPDTPVGVESAATLRNNMARELAKAPQSLVRALQPAIDKLDDLIADAGNSGIPFSTLRQIRTAIGKDLASPQLTGSSGAQNEALKRIYAALTEDMSKAAKQSGPKAAHALAVADRFTRQFMNTSAKTLEKIAKLDADEKAFDFVTRAGKDSAQQLARLRRAFTNEEWDTIAGTSLHRLGLARAGGQNAASEAFSVNTFLTNWSKLTPEAKKLMFGGTRYSEVAGPLDDLVQVVGSLKEIEKLTNTSNTGRTAIAWMTMQSLLGGLGGVALGGGDPATAAGGALLTIAAPFGAAKLITNPRFVKWLITPVTSTNGVSAHIGRLLAIAEAEPQIREEIEQYVQALRPVGK